MTIRSILAAFAVFLSGTALAQQCVEYQVTGSFFAAGWKATAAAACAATVGQSSSDGVYIHTVTSAVLDGICQVEFRSVASNGSVILQSVGWSVEERRTPGACPPDTPSPSSCTAKAGTNELVNITAGWQRTPSTAANQDWLFPTKLGPGGAGMVCNQGCTQTFSASDPCPECGPAFVSQVPSAAGLYRVSIDFNALNTGTACVAGPADSIVEANDSKDPPCPGYVGEVNGVRGCYGTAQNPIIPVPPDPHLDFNGKDKGNPAAGTKPASGEGSGLGGSGRTPSAGTGGSAGGPTGAGGSGAKPDGTNDKPGEGKEQANCGAPGQPKCGIDESGTPKKFDGDGKGLDDWKTSMETNRDQIKGSGDGIFSGMDIFFSAPPVAGCSPYELPKDMGSIDPCGVADGVRAVMAYIWALGGLFLCIGWIREAV